MATDPEFRRAIEDIKSRATIEEIVREHVEVLVPKGRLLWACCPLHQEDTPSFKIDPATGLWYCFGACSEGGDVIQFVQRKYGMDFREALELLAAKTGVELPQRRGQRDRGQDDAGLAVLARAEQLYREALRSREGRVAREYLTSRGISENTIEAFGIGYAPSDGQALVRLAKSDSGGGEGLSPRALVDTGLVRVRERDRRPYDFFRGRLMIPIRDDRGRTVGFGARRLVDDEVDGRPAGPKYVNTSETPWFHKGRLIYAFDRVVDDVRKHGHLVLVEGYTDVMAAHQAGLRNVGAVLGTSTTEQHAALVRRAATKRVTLVFDGDEAGRKAAWKALRGLLPLDLELAVVGLPEGQDPADLLAGGDPAPFQAQLEMAAPWFEFITRPLQGLRGRELSREVDQVLELLHVIESPVYRESLIGDLAGVLGMPADALRDQYRALPLHRRAGGPRPIEPGFHEPGDEVEVPSQAPGGSAADQPSGPELSPEIARRLEKAYEGVLAVALADSGVLPRLRPLADACPRPDQRRVLEVLFELWDEGGDLGATTTLTRLADHPARELVPNLVEYARVAEDLATLFEEQLTTITTTLSELEYQRLLATVHDLEQRAAQGDEHAAEQLPHALHQLNLWIRNRETPGASGPPSRDLAAADAAQR